MFIIAGLGNPDQEYKNTRHNTGRMMLEAFRVENNLSEWEADGKSKSLISKGEVIGEKVVLVEPETYMNKSGVGVAYFVKTKKAAEKLVVIYDDLDLPIGSIRVSFNKSSGGHRGLQSIISAIKTEAFLRVRVGISPVTAGVAATALVVENNATILATVGAAPALTATLKASFLGLLNMLDLNR